MRNGSVRNVEGAAILAVEQDRQRSQESLKNLERNRKSSGRRARIDASREAVRAVIGLDDTLPSMLIRVDRRAARVGGEAMDRWPRQG